MQREVRNAGILPAVLLFVVLRDDADY